MFTEIAVSSDYNERTRSPAIVKHDLPLPELMPLQEPMHDEQSVRGGGVFDSGSHTILWRTTDGTLSLELANLNGSENGLLVLEFEAPGRILPHCFLITDAGQKFVVDFFTEVGFLYTFELPYTIFEDWNVDSEGWASVKCPFGVDTVAVLGLAGLSELELVATLSDASVVALQRQSTLAEIELHHFHDPHEPGFLKKLWRSAEEYIEVGSATYSVKAGVDVCYFQGNVLTISVDGSLRVWDPQALTLKDQRASTTRSKYLTRPSNYFKTGKNSLCVFTDGQFLVYDAQLARIESISLPDQLASWYMVDFIYGQQIVAAFRSAGKSQIWSLGDEQYQISVASPPMSRVPDAREMQRFVEHIFSVKTYSSTTLRHALADFLNTNEANVADLTIHAPISSSLSLRDAITQAVKQQAIAEKSDYRLQWIRFDSLCQQYESILSEVLAVGKSSDGLLWSVRSSYYTLLCPISNVQRALLVESDTPHNETLMAIKDLHNVFPTGALAQFEQELRKNVLDYGHWGSQLPSARIAAIYEHTIQPYINDKQILEIRNALTNIEDIDSKIQSILAECLIKDPAKGSQSDTITPLGCSALATITLNHAENSIEFVSKVLLFTLFAYGEGITHSHLKIYTTGLSHLQTSWAIVSLQEPLDSTVGGFNSQASALQVSVSRLYIHVYDFNSLIARLWHQLDFTDKHNLWVLLDLVRLKWYHRSLLNAAEYLADDPESQFVKGLAKLSTPDQQAVGDKIIRAFAPQISIEAPSVPIEGLGKGISSYFYAVSQFCREVGVANSSTLPFIEMAARYSNHNIGIYTELLDLALNANNHFLAYEAICALARAQDPEVRAKLEKFLEEVISHKSMDFVCKDLVFAGLADLVPEIMASRPILGGEPTYQLHYIWCISRCNYLGAAKVIYAHITRDHPADAKDLYTITLNAMSLVDEKARWFVVDKQVITAERIEQEFKSLA